MVSKVNGRVNPFEMNEVALNPFTKCKILDIDMSCTCRSYLGVAHSRAAVVVLVSNGRGFLGDVKVPEDTANKEGHTPYITGGHEFGLGCREGHSGLESCFVGNSTARQLDANSA